MSEGMREFFPHDKYPKTSAILIEQYGRPAEEIVEEFFVGGNSTNGWNADLLVDYLYDEFSRVLIQQGYYADFEDGEQLYYGDTEKTQFFVKAIEDRGAKDVLRMAEAPAIEEVKFVYAVAEYIGETIDKQRAFEASRQEAVIVPPVFDESIFAQGR